MVKILVSAIAIMAVTSSAALACSGHKSGGKGGSTTAQAPASAVVLVVKKA